MRMRLPGRIAVYALVTVSVLLVLFPLLWMIGAALKSNAEIIDPNSALIPLHPGSKVTVTWTDTSGQSHTTTLTLGTGPSA